MAQSLKDRFVRLKAHYPDIVRFENFDVKKLMKVYDQLKEVKDFAIVQYQEDMLNYVAMALVLLNGKYESYVFMNAYELIDIYLGNKEEFKCLSDIECQMAIVYMGYNEFENKRQADVLEQLMQLQRVEKKKFYLLYRGTAVEAKYPTVATLFKDYKYPIVTLSNSPAGSVSVDEEL